MGAPHCALDAHVARLKQEAVVRTSDSVHLSTLHVCFPMGVLVYCFPCVYTSFHTDTPLTASYGF